MAAEAKKLLSTLSQQGFKIRLDGEQLLLSPASALTAEQLGDLRARKPEILAALRGQDPSNSATWPLEEINRRRAVLVLFSRLLGQHVLFVHDGWQRPAHEARPAFPVSLLRRIARLRPPVAVLRTIADAQAVFGGDLILRS